MADFVMNKEGKYGYLFVQDLSGAPADKVSEEALARYRTFGDRQLWIDGNCVPGAFQMNTCFWCKPNAEMIRNNPDGHVGRPHSHSYPEIIGFVGTDPENPLELGGTVEFWVGGECHHCTKSTMVFIPPDTPHCPLMILDVGDHPILHFSVVMNDVYTYDRDGKTNY